MVADRSTDGERNNTFFMKIEEIHHISIIVGTETVVEFYKSILGFKEVFRIERDNDTVVILEGANIELQFFVDERHSPKTTPEPLGLRNLSFRVDDIEKTVSELGLENSTITDWFGQRYIIITDPDGNQIQLHE